jgi:hypothetical protein
MTAIRNFPNAPLPRRTAAPFQWRVPAFALRLWHGLERIGQRRAARELRMLANRHALGNPLLARQLRGAAAECRRAAEPSQTQNQAERSPS